MNSIEQPILTIVAPVFNEELSVEALVYHIDRALTEAKIRYHMILVDDRSTDGTREVIDGLSAKYPLTLLKKDASIARGKAASLILGFTQTRSPYIGMIDADLQYPPHEIIPMMRFLTEEKYDLVVANRQDHHTSIVRRILSNSYRLIFGRILHGFTVDVQSGLKIFRREIFERSHIQPASQWMFDLELLTFARSAGYRIGGHPIRFNKRYAGKAKIGIVRASLEMGISAILLKFRKQKTIPFHKNQEIKQGTGFHYKGESYISHTALPQGESAFFRFTRLQKISLLLLGVLFLGGLFINWHAAITIVVAVLSILYFADLIFNLFLISRSFGASPEIQITDEEITNANGHSWPTYTVLCPLYREGNVLPQFISAMKNLDYPAHQLQIILLLEEDDEATIETAASLLLPANMEVVIVPHSRPKTKPKALNYGLAKASGEYVVVYDAEDIPDPLQLKKAVVGFAKVDKETICIQAKLNFYNSRHNLLTKIFSAEYSLWFDLILTGLQSIRAPIPLGGTSNHFRIADLRRLYGWDAFNVTEDCDLGMRLTKQGFKTAMVNSVTMEEASSTIRNWFGQRSRWIKGYIQTYVVHMRNPFAFLHTASKFNVLSFQLVVGGKIMSMFINPFFWFITIIYFSWRSSVGEFIESFFPAPILYMGVFCLVFGNFIYMYSYMLGIAKREEWHLAKYVFLVPFYWVFMSIAAWKALWGFFVNPHFWSKTVHGFHLDTKGIDQQAAEIVKNQYFGFGRWTTKLSPQLRSAGILVVVSMIGNVFNYLTNAYLGRSLSVEDFGLVSLMNSLFFLADIPLTAFSRTVTYRSAYLLGTYGKPLKSLWIALRRGVWLPGGVIVILWLIASPLLAHFFQAESFLPFVLIAPLWFISVAAAVDSGFLTGSMRFVSLAAMILVEVISRFLATVLLIHLGLHQYIYMTFTISSTLAFLTGWIAATRIHHEDVVNVQEKIISLPRRFFVSSLLTKVSSISFLSLDVILAKHYLPPKEAGYYALLSLVGKMIYFLGTLFSQFITPVVSREEGAGKNAQASFQMLLMLTSMSVLAGYIAVGVYGFYTVPFLLGAKTLPILVFLPTYTLGMACFAISQAIVFYHLSKKEYVFSFINFILLSSVIMGIFFFHDAIVTINAIVTVGGLGSLFAIILLHAFHEKLAPLGSNAKDFLGLFTIKSAHVNTSAHYRILIMNWRDTKHVWAGGAEVYLYELAKRWVADGHRVTFFCGNDGKKPRNQQIDGIRIIRRGGFYTVYLWALIYYILRFRKTIDVVIDSMNGVPFFTPLYASVPTLLVLHHVHQKVFREHLPLIPSYIARIVESKLMPFVYRNRQIVTVSNSSKVQIVRHGLSDDDHVEVINPGVEMKNLNGTKKTAYPSFLYLGRLKAYKNVDVMVAAFAQLLRTHPDAILTVAGYGESRRKLEEQTSLLGIGNHVRFLGRVNENEKIRLMAQCWALVHPSSVEGWGITVIEANSCGTPVIGSNIYGLRDSIIAGKTGLLVKTRNVDAFARAMETLIINPEVRKKLSQQAREWAKEFSWEDSATKFLRLIDKTTLPTSVTPNRAYV